MVQAPARFGFQGEPTGAPGSLAATREGRGEPCCPYNRPMDHHAVALVSIVGTCLDVLGSLYLAYDLLGGQHGPLRLLTRAVTYSIVFGIGYGIGLGIVFGLASGIATGLTVSIEFNRAARGLDHYPLPVEAIFSAVRGLAFGVGLYGMLGLQFAGAFALLITIGQISAYSRGMRPAVDYVAWSRRPRLTRRQFWGTVARTVGYTATALICSVLAHHVDHAWAFALRVGLVTGIATGAGLMVYPYEYYADNLPERRMGVFGIALILSGFALQSLQYWLALLDVRLT